MNYEPEYYECALCDHRITKEAYIRLSGGVLCPNCDEKMIRDYKPVYSEPEPLSPLAEAVRKASGRHPIVKSRRFA